MKSEIVSKIKNPFLRREELIIKIESEVTPRISEIVELTKEESDKVVVNKIKTNFGTKKCTADVFVYETKEAKEAARVIPKKIRKKMEEERKKAEAEAKKKAEEEAKKKAEEKAKGDEKTE